MLAATLAPLAYRLYQWYIDIPPEGSRQNHLAKKSSEN